MKSIEELLQYARENYPPGTKFIACTGNQLIVEECVPILIHDDKDVCVKTDKGNGSYFNNKGAIIYWGGKWAKIISKPKLNYEIY